ncbi:MAG TPA: hypothetical protein VFC74_05755 [Oscillospiraceae bacterium]|nr:hypothetical protein [Oscillospiraceae bacterium]
MLKVYALDEIPDQERKSNNFDFHQTVTKPQKRYVPPMSHPWKAKAFTDYVKAQKHHIAESQKAFEDIIYSQEIMF